MPKLSLAGKALIVVLGVTVLLIIAYVTHPW
jgi:hypothetical protein